MGTNSAFSRIMVGGLAAAGLLVCVNGLWAEGDRLSVMSAELASAIRSDRAGALAAAKQAAARHDGDCTNDFRRGATAIAFADLPSRMDQSYDARLSAATIEIKEQLRCSPSDGNAWLLLAMVSEMAGQHGLVPDYLKLSQFYSPREGWILVQRIGFVCSLPEPNLDEITELVRSDFRALLSDRVFDKAAGLYDGCRNEAGKVLEDLLSKAPPDVSKAFAREMAKKTNRAF